MIVSNILLGVFAIIWLYFLWSRRKFYVLFMKMRGPMGYPILGMAHKFTKREGILNVLLKNEQKYGRSFLSWLGPIPFLIVADPVITEAILSSADFIDKAFVYDVLVDGTGGGLFSLNTPLWGVHRKLINPAFNHKVLLSFVPIFNREAEKLKVELNELVGAGEVDLTTILQKCTINVAAQTTMGRKMASKKDNDKDLLHCYKSVLETMTSMVFSPWLRKKFLLQLTANYPSYIKAKQGIRNFSQHLIKEKLSQQEDESRINAQNESGEDMDIKKNSNIFIDRAIELLKSGDFNWKDVEDESNVIVFGAFETTANTVGNTLMTLAMFPEYQDKVFEELTSIIPSPDSTAEVTYEDIQQMTYMDMVINETMRVMAPVPIIAREAVRDSKLPNGVVLPKGLQIAIDIFNMHRDPKYWGEDSTNFNPDNFLPANIADKHPYAFIPFSKGPRNCIGWKYALIATKIILSKLLRKYRLSTTFKFQDLHYVEDLTLKLKINPPLEIHLRES